MRLTSFTDFALRTLMRLAADPDRAFTTEEIAQTYGISRHHLTKVVRELAEGGFIHTQRGAGGGMRLARAAKDITLGAVVRRMEAPQPIVECFRADGGDCVMTAACRLKARLARANEAFLTDLDRTSLQDCAWAPVAA
ncbi:MAG: Rrf2 family transcriptional regulator [Rhodobacteraceae bacterium]|nr:Rrf2 family transcriptional regulator [Paracoccaceae bacterium]